MHSTKNISYISLNMQVIHLKKTHYSYKMPRYELLTINLCLTDFL
jgi:hypothetical protein